VLRAWLDAPEYISAALQHMAESGQAVTFARALRIHDARALVKSIAHSFALHELQSVLDTFLDDSSRTMRSGGKTPTALDVVLDDSSQTMRGRDKTLQSGDAAYRNDPLSSVSDTPQSAPWQRWVPESQGNGLRLEQQCLLGIGLMLQRAPVIMRRHQNHYPRSSVQILLR
jgi:hypothetical protein